MRVSFFVTCLADQFYAEAAADAVRLLRKLGVEVDFPRAQTCCGQPAYNAGYWNEAHKMARHTLDVFHDSEYVVLPSGSCTTMLRTFYPNLLSHHGQGYKQASDLAARTFELSEFIVEVLGIDHLGHGLAGRKVAYHFGCHALRELGIKEAPLRLLRNAGAEILPWGADEECCGFGGLFSVKLPEVSLAMADRKLSTLPQAEVLTSTDAGCLLHLSGRAKNKNQQISARPLASLLWEAAHETG